VKLLAGVRHIEDVTRIPSVDAMSYSREIRSRVECRPVFLPNEHWRITQPLSIFLLERNNYSTF
jgi:hypothetical protein